MQHFEIHYFKLQTTGLSQPPGQVLQIQASFTLKCFESVLFIEPTFTVTQECTERVPPCVSIEEKITEVLLATFTCAGYFHSDIYQLCKCDQSCFLKHQTNSKFPQKIKSASLVCNIIFATCSFQDGLQSLLGDLSPLHPPHPC